MSESNLVHIVAVKVHVTPTLEVFEVYAIATLQHVQTWRGQRLAQKIFGVLLEPVLRLGIHLFVHPVLSVRREIQIAFGLETVGIRHWLFHFLTLLSKTCHSNDSTIGRLNPY